MVLTSYCIRVLDGLLLDNLTTQVTTFLNLLQFAYCSKVGWRQRQWLILTGCIGNLIQDLNTRWVKQTVFSESSVLCSHPLGQQNQSQGHQQLNKLIKKSGSVVGTTLEPIQVAMERRMPHKLFTIMKNTEHPFHDLPIKQQSIFCRTRLQFRCNTEQYRQSFLHAAKKKMYDDFLLRK